MVEIVHVVTAAWLNVSHKWRKMLAYDTVTLTRRYGDTRNGQAQKHRNGHTQHFYYKMKNTYYIRIILVHLMCYVLMSRHDMPIYRRTSTQK